MTIDIIPRFDWGARKPRHRNRIDTPTPELWLHHTAGNHRGTAGMRAIQNFHMDSRGWSDIAYSFVVDRISLEVFEGRGAGIAGGHTHDHNRISHAICVMGNFETLTPLPELLDLLAELVAHGHTLGWWPDQFTGGHRDVANTLCPGANLYARIPDINRLALKEPMPRINAAAVNVGYTPTTDPDQLAANVEDMAQGITKLIADKALLGDQIAHLLNQLEQAEADAELGRAVRALVEAEQ